MTKPFILLTFLLCVLCSCEKNDATKILHEDFLKKGWKLTELKINGVHADLSARGLTELMLFDEQNLCYTAIPVLDIAGTWQYEDHRTAWNYDYSKSILNISAFLPITIYTDNIDKNRLDCHYYKYNTEGELDLYEKSFVPAEVVIENLKVRLKE